MRASHYLVLSDTALAAVDGGLRRLVLHTRTGQVYVIADAIARSLVHDSAALTESTVRELAAAELLVDDDADEFTVTVRENATATTQQGKRIVVLMPSAYCNMGCGYCGQRHTARPPSQQHRDDVVTRLRHIVATPATEELALNWFGGEPMTGYAQILDISAAAVRACDERGVAYSSSMVTNGSLLTVSNLRRLYTECRVSTFEITLDGPAASHDEQRPLHTGRGSFDRIVRTIAAACTEDDLPDLRFNIRTNISVQNQHTHREFAATMREAGLAHPKISFYFALVRPWGNDVSEYAVPAAEVIEVERQWMLAYRDHGLAAPLLPIKRVKQVCVAVSRAAEVIDPDGLVYSCTEQPLVPSRAGTAVAQVTDLQSPRLRPLGSLDSWHDELLGTTQAHCPSCAIFPICGGSCPLEWREGRVPCPPLKVTLPMRLTLYGESLGLRPAV